MDFKFTNWYTQALGATLGVLASIYAYLNGFMFVYGNINRNFDYLGFDGVISSYFLIPLCFLTLILSIMRLSIEDEMFINVPFMSINKWITIITVIIGFMGAKIYFIIPALLIIFHLVSRKLIKTTVNDSQDKDKSSVNKINNSNKPNNIDERKAKLALAKREIAIDLLNKNADIEFIKDITGLTEEEIHKISN